MKKPMKCKCGKMINRPKANKSGLCSSCNLKRMGKIRDEKRTANINNASLEVQDGN